MITGGFGTGILELLQTENILSPVERIGWPDTFVEHGSSVKILRESVGLDSDSILDRVLKRLAGLGIQTDSPAESANVTGAK